MWITVNEESLQYGGPGFPITMSEKERKKQRGKNGGRKESTNARTHERTNARTHERTDARTDRWVIEQMNETY